MTLTTRLRTRFVTWLIHRQCRHLDATHYRQSAPWGIS